MTQVEYEHERHFVIYPILFNYRHGLELAMKWTILMYGGEGLKGIAEIQHDLWKPGKRCREIADDHGNPDTESDNAIEQIVKDFHDFDKAGINFRYGWIKDGKAINLPEHMVALGTFAM